MGSSRIAEVLEKFARRAEMEFIWQPMGVHAMGDSGWVMPALDKLLAVK